MSFCTFRLNFVTPVAVLTTAILQFDPMAVAKVQRRECEGNMSKMRHGAVLAGDRMIGIFLKWPNSPTRDRSPTTSCPKSIADLLMSSCQIAITDFRTQHRALGAHRSAVPVQLRVYRQLQPPKPYQTPSHGFLRQECLPHSRRHSQGSQLCKMACRHLVPLV